MVPLDEDQVLSKQLQHHALLAVKITHEAERPGLVGLVHHYLSSEWSGSPMAFSQAFEGGQDTLLPETPTVSYASLTLAVEPTFDSSGLAYHAQQPIEGRVERHLLSFERFAACS